MSQTYALTCQCGQAVPVEAKHAGSTVTCGGCSEAVEVPKLREIRQLEPIAAASQRSKGGVWSGLQGFLFAIGMLALAIAAGSMYYTYSHRAEFAGVEKPKPEEIVFERDINQITLVDSWETWLKFKEIRMSARPTPYYVYAKEKVARYDVMLKTLGGIALAGLASVILSFVVAPRS